MTEMEMWATLIFMIAMVVLQLYMVGRSTLLQIVCFLSMLFAAVSVLELYGTLYFIPMAFLLVSGVTFVFAVMHD